MSDRKKVGAIVDLESLSRKNTGALLSIGVILFDQEFNEVDEPFFEAIELQSCLDVGCHVEADTFYWWMQQSDGAREALFGTKALDDRDNDIYVRKNLSHVLHLLTTYLHKYNVRGIWGNGASFDLGMLQNAYHAVGKQIPWKYSFERDIRTIVAMRPSIKKTIVEHSDILAHHPVDDCRLELEYLSAIFDEIGELPWHINDEDNL